MKSRKKVLLWAFLVPLLVILTAGYLLIGFGYRGKFCPGIFINGVYCTGKTAEEVNLELKSAYQRENLVMVDSENKEYSISLKDIGFTVDYEADLKRILGEGNPFMWPLQLKKSSHRTLSPTYGFDESAVITCFENTGITENQQHDTSVTIIPGENGYELYDGTAHVFMPDEAVSQIVNALRQGLYRVDLSDCYQDLDYDSEMLDTLNLFTKIKKYQDCDLVYDMGDEEIAFRGKRAADFLLTGPDGSFVLDETGNLCTDHDKIEAFVDDLCMRYDTYETVHHFPATRGETVDIEGGNYGTLIDRDAEIAYLERALKGEERGVHIPAYSHEAKGRGVNDLGDTYVEIDLTNQMLYYYKDGELFLSTEVVTGNLRLKHDTPTGVYYVYAKQRNRILRGADYESFVKYWMPVIKGVGIHDASWRSSFGGEIYKTKGSHGCINIPSDVAADLYDNIEVGTPVAIFY